MKENTLRQSGMTIGIDLSDLTSRFVCLGASSALPLKEGEFDTTPEGRERAFSHDTPSRCVLEASTHSSWVARQLRELGHEVFVANPRKVHLISKSSRKTDRNDAITLARLGRSDPGLLHPVWVRPESSQTIRAGLRARSQLVRTRTKLINLVRAESKVHGHRLPAFTSAAFSKKARGLVPTVLADELGPIFDTLDTLSEQIRRYDALVEKRCEEHPVTHVLRQVHGVGSLGALAFFASIVDPKRFKDSRLVGAYLGLAPRSFQSGSNNPHLRISKEGDRELRTLLVNAATHIMRRSSPDCSLKRFGRRIANRGNPRDRARARIAVARKLATILHRLWLTGEVYEPLRAAPAK